MGTEIVSGFTPYQGSIYKASMSWSMGRGKDQVFVGGVVRPEARFPNEPSPGLAYSVPVGPLWPPLGAFSIPTGTTDRVTSELLNGQAEDFWSGALYSGMHYQSYHAQTADITHSASGVLFVTPLVEKWYNTTDGWLPEIGRGSISGVLAALDAPGEWVVKNGSLYLWPPQGQDPSSMTAEAKARQLAFDLAGKSYITIRNLEVIGASLKMNGSSYCEVDGVKFSFVSQVNHVVDDALTDLSPQRGEAGIFLGGHHNTVKNSVIADSARSGLVVTGRGHLITNNVIHDCGWALSPGSSCIEITVDRTVEAGLADRGGHEISFNTIYNSGMSSIGLGRDVVQFNSTGRAVPTPFRKIWIHHNELYNANLLRRDGGMFYTFGAAGGTYTNPGDISYNIIHDELEPWNMGAGIYLDQGSANFKVHHNLIWLGREGPGSGPESWASCSNLRRPVFFNDGRLCGQKGPYPPGYNRHAYSNSLKWNYRGSVAGLANADFPDGKRFAVGANSQAPTPFPLPKK
ncbi:MAG: right-handed parallel beta-helix repeat-containing protein [Nitrospira sp.]|nr:right-handed parallel beta-helix repeat-containing protein [Nitrospira sp.]